MSKTIKTLKTDKDAIRNSIMSQLRQLIDDYDLTDISVSVEFKKDFEKPIPKVKIDVKL